jgi:hypothetical protein
MTNDAKSASRVAEEAILGHATIVIGHFFKQVALVSQCEPHYYSPVFCDGSRTGHARRKGRTPCDFLTAVGVVFQCRAEKGAPLWHRCCSRRPSASELWKGHRMQRFYAESKTHASLILAAVFAVSLSSQVRAQDALQGPRVARLVEQLGSERFQDRDRASHELAKLGTTPRRQLEAATQSPDPEVRLRAADLLAQIRALDLWAPSLIDCRLNHAPLSQALSLLVDQSGNHVQASDLNGKFNDRPVTLNFAQIPFWQVLDEACRQSNNHVRCHYDTRESGFLLSAGPASTAPTAYAGPFRAQITRLARTFSDRLDFGDDGPQRIHAFDIDVQMVWEDRFRLVAFRTNPVIVEATAATGESLTPVQGVPGSWQACPPSTKQLQARLGLSPPPVAAAELSRLTLRWTLMAVGEMRQVVIDDLAEARRADRDNVELIIDSVERRDRDRIEIACVVARDISLPDPAEIVFQEYRVDLQDTDGRPWRSQGSSCLLTDRGVQIRTTFVRDGQQGEPKSLVLHYPAVRSQRDLEFSFLHVPLPHSNLD